MSQPPVLRGLDFGGPAVYRIVVQGNLDESFSDFLAGMRISVGKGEDGLTPHTTLLGQLQDQAELSGVLDTLHGLRLPILMVEVLNERWMSDD